MVGQTQRDSARSVVPSLRWEAKEDPWIHARTCCFTRGEISIRALQQVSGSTPVGMPGGPSVEGETSKYHPGTVVSEMQLEDKGTYRCRYGQTGCGAGRKIPF